MDGEMTGDILQEPLGKVLEHVMRMLSGGRGSSVSFSTTCMIGGQLFEVYWDLSIDQVKAIKRNS